MNKREKYDRLVQKLSEIWVSETVFWEADNSIIHEVSSNKIQRFQKIAKEATEQSWWYSQAKISISKDIFDDIKGYEYVYIADYHWVHIDDLKDIWWSILFIVWPEGGFSKSEMIKFEEAKVGKILLWDTVLRTETAAILWWRLLKNMK